MIQVAYEMLCALLSDSDVVIRLAAAVAIRVCMYLSVLLGSNLTCSTWLVLDSSEFCAEDFERYVEVVTERVFQLVRDTESIDSHMQLIKLIHMLLLTVGEHVHYTSSHHISSKFATLR
jgi:hypothetical protein